MTLFAFFDIQLDRVRRTLEAPSTATVSPSPRRRQVNVSDHGTLHCYAVLHCRCMPCRAANAEYKRGRRAVQRVKLARERPFRHGHGGYVTHGCRCRVCCEARIAYRARPAVKAKQRAYMQRPEVKAKQQRAYQKTYHLQRTKVLIALGKQAQREAQHGESPTA